MKTEIEKIRELKEIYQMLISNRFNTPNIRAESKEIREKAEKGCGKTKKRICAENVNVPYLCGGDRLCPKCEEIIKLAKEIEG